MNSSDFVPIAAAAFFIWHCLARTRPPGIAQVVPLLPPAVQRFLGCPWCCGAWASIGLTALTVALPAIDLTTDWPALIITALAAAGLVGLTGSLLPDDGGTD